MTLVVHRILGADGVPLQGQTVTIALMLRHDVAPDSYRLNAPDPFTGAPISRFVSAVSDASGQLTWDLVPNDLIVPSGTYYEVFGLGNNRTFLYVPDNAASVELSECTLTLVELGGSNLVLVQGPRGRPGGDTTGGTGLPGASSTTQGILRLAGDLGGTADTPTVPGLAALQTGKANTVHTHVAADVSDSTTTGRAVLKATDAAAARAAIGAGTSSLALGTTPGTAKAGDYAPPDAAATTKGLIKVAGDLGGTADTPTVPALANKANLGHTHPVTDLTATGTRDSTKFLRADNVWAVPPGGGGSSSSGQISVRDYGAKGDGTTDDLAAINAAVAAVALTGGTLLFPPGVYYVSSTLLLAGLTDVVVRGHGATISSGTQSLQVVKISGCTHLTFTGFEVRHSSTSGGRTGAGYGIHNYHNTDVSIIDNVIHDTTSAGIYTDGSVRVHIRGNTVRNNLADGIHNTGTSTDVVITNNTVSSPGDDGIAVVSYQSDTNPCRRVSITNNVVLNGLARGISVVGGTDITVSGNVVDGTRAAGIMVCQETSFSSLGVVGVAITGNVVSNAATITTGGSIGHPGIYVSCADGTGAFTIEGVTITGNVVRTPQQNGYRCQSTQCNDILWQDNLFIGPSKDSSTSYSAFLIQSANNYVRGNLAVGATGYGFNCQNAVVTDNDVRNATGGTYTLTSCVAMNNRPVAAGTPVGNVVTLTQAAYTALSTTDPATLYVIVG